MVSRHAVDLGGAARRTTAASRPAGARRGLWNGRLPPVDARSWLVRSGCRRRSRLDRDRARTRSGCRRPISTRPRSNRSPFRMRPSSSWSRTTFCSMSTSTSSSRASASYGASSTPGGTLLLRTNGARRSRRSGTTGASTIAESLIAELERAGLSCERVTYANSALSLYGALRGRSPAAPSERRDGIPQREPSRIATAVGTTLLTAEAQWLARPRRTLPYGHTLFAVACPA